MSARRKEVETVARAPAFVAALERARRFARVNATVLITGESGTGKERLARYIHECSRRARGPYVAVNTGAIPENLLESELFGYLKGAFTGANRDVPGLFTAADGGTLFLDEVGEMPPAMQAKLLRALQEREIRPVGARQPRPVDVRVVAATNADLIELVGRGAFREDLYFRLNVVGVHVPPLRERTQDVRALAEQFAMSAARRLGVSPMQLSRGALEALAKYDWPGNVRELENAIEHAVALTDGAEIGRAALPDAVLGRGPALRRRGTTGAGGAVQIGAAVRLDVVIQQHIDAVLASVGGSPARAAAILGVAPSTLWRRRKHASGSRVRG